MKNILITGAGSYIGVSLENYLKQWPESYRVDSLDMRGSDWESHSFRSYDAVFHVAGLVHQPDSKNDPARSDLYDQVNHILAVRTAEKAKTDGVGQFLFMSSESVYGLTAPIGKTVVITKDTPLHPADNYGVSKAKAEAGLQALADDSFKVNSSPAHDLRQGLQGQLRDPGEAGEEAAGFSLRFQPALHAVY